ncbi:MAG TPA: methylated-DNA--[protein]-cysteine S-methyltransferase [Candidatus Dormibacteraeota bacterium]|nr:methylated-DNA--[protein]-cysteine S-methyltransferase [Candidatus Dormibacteraeota bacterium]
MTSERRALTVAPIPTSQGTFEACFSDLGLRALRFPDPDHPQATQMAARSKIDPRLRLLAEELEAYLGGQLRSFSVPIDLSGTPFQLGVWRQLLAIPYGEVRTYREVATALGRATALRAVGAAVGANPVPILVPCHRVVGSDGRLVGFAAGLKWKRCLLAIEAGAGGAPTATAEATAPASFPTGR